MRKRTSYPRSRRWAIQRPIRPLTYSVKRTFYLENWQPNSTTTVGFWRYYSFRLEQLPNIGEYQVLFDQARINAIKVDFHPRYSAFDGSNTTDTIPPGITNQAGTRLTTAVDPANQLTPTGTYNSFTYNGMLEFGNAKTSSGDRVHSVYFKPMVNQANGTSQFGSRRRAPYMQLVDGSTVSHNGFHVFAWDPNFNGSFGQSFDVLVTYYVTFRGMR